MEILLQRLILLCSVISSLVSIIIIRNLQLREKRRVHRMFLLLNLSLFAYTTGLAVFSILIPIIDFPTSSFLFLSTTYPFLVAGYIGLVSFGVHWYHVAACYAGDEDSTHGWRRTFAYLPTAMVALILALIPSFEYLTIASSRITLFGLMDGISLLSGAVFTILAFRMYLKTVLDLKEKTYTRKTILLTIAGFLPILSGISYFYSLIIPQILNSYIPFVFLLFQRVSIIIANLLMAYALLRMDFLDILPVALREVFHHMNDAVLVLDPHFRVVQSNSAALQLFAQIPPGTGLTELSPHVASKTQDLVEDFSDAYEFEIEIDGYIKWCRVLSLRIKERLSGWILIFTDITQRKRVEEQLTYNALHDRLTGLPNRILLMDRMKQTLLQAQREKQYQYAVLFIDLDRFKLVNDSFGHQAGDLLLTEVAQRLQECVRQTDTVARIGGDEFIILLENIQDTRATTEIAFRIQKRLAKGFLIKGQEIPISVSIGIAKGAAHYIEPDDILSDSDMAMYQAKEAGKARHTIFDKEMHTRVASILQSEADLSRAIQHNEY
ncbi:MAG: hypothetical protein A2Z14_02320 [Chloroflexi bacterium RBG_16_48_8]|nr:MAG: hypothetical protein A2Z14_02320 [Chloroflexi bacterium RBG_16_48_8]